MAPNNTEISLYKKAKSEFISLLTQTGLVFCGLLVVLIFTRGNPPGFVVASSFILGIAFIAWSEKKHLSEQKLVNLSQWLQGNVDATWQAIEDLLGSEFAPIASSSRKIKLERENNLLETSWGKLIKFKLEDESVTQDVILTVNIERKKRNKMNIYLQVYSSNSETVLPQGLQLSILDKLGTPIPDTVVNLKKAKDKSKKDYIECDYNGFSGEHFQIELLLGNSRFIEKFII